MHRRVGLAFAILLGLTAVANAAATITVGAHVLLPNTPNQPIDITVSGNDTTVQGVELNAMVADGGPNAGGVITGPQLNGILDVVGGIFGINNTGIVDLNSQANPGIFGGQVLVLSTTTTGTSTVTDNGLLVRLLVDTTGFSTPGQSWALRLDTLPYNGVTFFGLKPSGSAQLVIIPGTISIVPEPSTVVLGLFAAAGLAAVAVRKNRARRAA